MQVLSSKWHAKVWDKYSLK